MNQIKIAFTDMWDPWNLEDFISPILSKHFKVIYDQKNPDVLFHSIFNRMSNVANYKCKKILILAENWRVSQFKSDYSISFDTPTETNFRLPLWQIYLLLKPELKEQLFDKIKRTSFDRFCAFTVSNPSNITRINHFELLSSYKKVHAYGKVKMNSYELKKESEGKYWRDAKWNFFNKNSHKFMMAYENSSYPGYCTEKLMDAFLSGSIPIYWGDAKVEEDFNPKSFINVMKNLNWLNTVKTLYENDTLFNEMYSEHVFTNDQKEKLLNNLENFEKWLVKIVQ
jgi:alpha(1,3/1,4) fucosyltransferase